MNKSIFVDLMLVLGQKRGLYPGKNWWNRCKERMPYSVCWLTRLTRNCLIMQVIH